MASNCLRAVPAVRRMYVRPPPSMCMEAHFIPISSRAAVLGVSWLMMRIFDFLFVTVQTKTPACEAIFLFFLLQNGKGGVVTCEKTSLTCINAQFFISNSVCMCNTPDIFLNLPDTKKDTINSPDPTAKLCFLSCGSFAVFYQPILFFSFSVSVCFSFSFFCLTGCHHIFSQLPTTSYSATTDLNTDLASSVPLRREQERYTQPPPAMLQGENFACLISLPAAGVHLVISSRFFLYTFCLSADQQHDWKTLLLALRTCGVHLDYRCFWFLILNVIMFWGEEVV